MRVLVIRALSAVMPLATVVMMIVFAVNTRSFLTVDNLVAVIAQNAALFIVAIAFAILLMAGYVDLSVGSTMALAGVAAGLAFNSVGVVPGIMAALIVGLAVGVFNGLLIGRFGMSALIVTLGVLAAARGIAMTLAPDSIYGFPDAVRVLGAGSFLGVPYIVWIAVAVAAAGLFVMGITPIGRHVLAIGVNPRAAFLVGIPVKRVVFALYAVVGLAAGLSGLVMVARLDSAPSGTLGLGFEVTVLTAVLLGGVPFTGGRGSLWKVLLGVWFIAIIKNGLTLMNVGPEVANVVSGCVLILAAGLETLQHVLRRRL
ncbi:ABC transporter permease [Microbacterium ureisolvens]|nr:ABC transporter permease [Microbacterium ureisolvens]